MKLPPVFIRHRKLSAIAVFVLLMIAVAFSRGRPAPEEFVTAPVKRSDLTVSVAATGVVEPEEVVDVGAQVAGQILSFGKDTKGAQIDYGSEVEEGTVLATIDDSLYSADVAQAEANVKRAQANAEQARAKLKLAQADWNRRKGLSGSAVVSQAEVDQYAANYDVARIGVTLADADVAIAESTLQRAQRNLSYCTIRSPVRGTIVDRRVNIGQTVVSSLNAPSLFLIARDLKNVAVWAAVNEADIANIHVDQNATFKVDAYPEEVFNGTVRRIRLNASMNQNVVSYVVEIRADNSTGKLLPYLTANVVFEVLRRPQVLTVPSSALHWSPPVDLIPREEKKANSTEGTGNTSILWVLRDGALNSSVVTIGGSDGKNTEIISGNLNEGDAIVLGMQDKNASAENLVNPFTPKIQRGRR